MTHATSSGPLQWKETGMEAFTVCEQEKPENKGAAKVPSIVGGFQWANDREALSTCHTTDCTAESLRGSQRILALGIDHCHRAHHTQKGGPAQGCDPPPRGLPAQPSPELGWQPCRPPEEGTRSAFLHHVRQAEAGVCSPRVHQVAASSSVRTPRVLTAGFSAHCLGKPTSWMSQAAGCMMHHVCRG